MIYQSRKDGSMDWQDFADGEVPESLLPGYEYRLKPEPEPPIWPKTTMGEEELCKAASDGITNTHQLYLVANAAIAKSCEIGQTIPVEELHQAKGEIADLKNQIAALTDQSSVK